MSKEDGKLNQHIVPQAHLDRFTDSKTMLHVHRFIDDERVKVYPTHPKHVSAEDNYYDDDDPYAERSIETFLKHQESIGQPSVDRILESRSNIQENRRVIKYVAMLLGRCIPFAVSKMPGVNPPPFNLVDEDQRYIRQESIFESMERPLLNDIQDMHCVHIRKEGGESFLTGDVPVAFMSLDPDWDRELMKDIEPLPPIPPSPEDYEANRKALNTIERLKEIFKNTVILCPISPNVCTILYHRSVEDVENRLRRILYPNPILAINTMIVASSVECVYANAPMKEYVETIRHRLKTGAPAVPVPDGNMTDPGESVIVPALSRAILLEVRFDRIESDIASRIGDIMKTFPVHDGRQMVEPDGSPVIVHEFHSEDGVKHVFVSARHITIATDGFSRWEGFKAEAVAVLGQFIREFGITNAIRVGLRTGYRLKPSALLNSGPLNMLSPPYAELFRVPPSTTHLGRVVREFSMEAWALVRVIVETPTLPDTEVGTVVDVDAYTEHPVSTDRLFSTVDELWGINRRAIEGATNEKLHKRLGIKD